VAPQRFDSYAQNGEDVVLWRALHDIGTGRYIDVGANDPRVFSISMAFYEQGWSGITVEPDPQFAAYQREQRPRDQLIEAAITAKDNSTATLHVIDGTGLSTLNDAYGAQHRQSGFEAHDITVPTRRLDEILSSAGWAGQEIHFMCVDTEGSEREVLESIDLHVWRPWILVVEATEPLTTKSTRHEWESLIIEADYHFMLFDGLSCFYVSDERREQLAPALSYPQCILDNYTTLPMRECWERSDTLQSELLRWRGQALIRWAADTVVAAGMRAQLDATQQHLHTVQADLHKLQQEHHRLSQAHHRLSQEHHLARQELGALRNSTSWRVTRPVRAVGARLRGRRGGR
jgi:FkbM family methyltransferase